MAHSLCISVTILDDLFHGCRDDDEPEWPPSPMRLFQALLAGSRLGCRNGQWNGAKAEAFRWLERQAPPVIIAPSAQRAAAYTLYVPNNDSDQKFERQDRLTGKFVQPQRIRSTECADANLPRLHYVWPIDDQSWADAHRHCDVLCQAARHLIALGWGVDQAFADGRVISEGEAMALPGQPWYPRKGVRQVQHMLRVPKPGSLADCERAYKAFYGAYTLGEARQNDESRLRHARQGTLL